MIIQTEKGRFHTIGVRLSSSGEEFFLVGRETGGDIDLCSISNPLDLAAMKYEISDYSVGLFTHDNWPEAQVLELNDDGKRMGLIFSLQALSSYQTVLASKASWNAYGLIALQLLCLGQYSFGPETWSIEQDTAGSLSALMGEDVIVVIIDHNSCQTAFNRSSWSDVMDRRLYSLAKHGVFPLSSKWRAVKREYTTPALQLDAKQTKMRLRPLSTQLPVQAEQFLSSALISIAPREKHPAFRFFLLYQALELLMEDLYTQATASFALAISGAASPSHYRDKFRAFHNEIAESERLSRVINMNRCADTAESFDELQDAIDLLLTACGEQQCANLESGVYSVRNLLFHRFASVELYRSNLESIAFRLLIAICDLVVFYKRPIITI